MGLSKPEIISRLPGIEKYPELLKAAHATLSRDTNCKDCNQASDWEDIRRKLDNAKRRDKR